MRLDADKKPLRKAFGEHGNTQLYFADTRVDKDVLPLLTHAVSKYCALSEGLTDFRYGQEQRRYLGRRPESDGHWYAERWKIVPAECTAACGCA